MKTNSRVITIAAEYAYTGILWLTDQLRGEPAPLTALTIAMTQWRTGKAE